MKSTSNQSAGILVYRIRRGALEFLLLHPGGPYWKNKDEGSWSIPKGLFENNEEPLAAAKREFQEETSLRLTSTDFRQLTPVRQKAGKLIYAWAINEDLSLDNFESNKFDMEWPPRSGKRESFPEMDKAAWFNLKDAVKKINEGQVGFLREVEGLVELD